MEKYTAFISYRHKPIDIAVATRLHRLLERYTVPKALRKEGQKHLGKVFRDRDELSLDSDLTQRLRDALDASDYLIVVCTPDTPDSPWVTEEISYFLKNHSQDRVFTVLADGTSENSFPAALTQEYDDGGNPIHGRTHEPLAANTAADTDRERMQKLENEFLRLVAPMLGCTYDELYRREARYRRKRRIIAASVVVSVVALFAATLAVTNARINKQAQEAQINRSVVMAKVSRSELDDGNTLQALKTAYAAVPEDGKTPVTPEVQNALAKSLYAYRSMSYRPDICIDLWNPVQQAVFSADSNLLFARDSAQNLYLINSNTGEILWTAGVSERYLDKFRLGFFADGSTAVYADMMYVMLFDTDTGVCRSTLKYTDCEPDTVKGSYYNCELSSDGRMLALLKHHKEDGTYILLLNLETGVSIAKYMLKDNSSEVLSAVFSADGSYLYVLFNEQNQDKTYTYYLHTLDAVSGTLLRENSFQSDISYSYHWLLPLKFPKRAGVYLVMRDIFYDKNCFAFIYDEEKDWEQKLELYGELIDVYSVYAVPKPEEDSIYTFMGRFVLRFPLSGADFLPENFKINNYLPGSAEGAFSAAENAIDVIVSNGEKRRLWSSLDLGRLGSSFVLTRKGINALFGPSVYGAPFAVVPTGNACTLQIFRISGDPNLREMEEPFINTEEKLRHAEDLIYPLPDGNSILYYSIKLKQVPTGDDIMILFDYCGTVYNGTGEVIKTFHFTDTEYFLEPMGFSQDGRLIYFSTHIYDIETGELFAFDDSRIGFSDLEINGVSNAAVASAAVNGGADRLYGALEGNSLFVWYNSDTPREIPLPDGYVVSDVTQKNGSAEKKELIVGENGLIAVPCKFDDNDDPCINGILLYSVETGTWSKNCKCLMKHTATVAYALAQKSGFLAVARPDNTVLIYDMKHANAVRRFPTVVPSAMIYNMRFIMDDSVLYLRLKSGRIWLIDASDGSILYQTENSSKGVQWDAEKHLLFLYDADVTGEVIDTENWVLLYEIPGMAAYLEKTGQAVLSGNGSLSLADLYTVDDLTAWARQKLAGREAGVAE